jgi:ATP-dependent Lon protease
MKIEEYEFPMVLPILREDNVFIYNFMIMPIFIEDDFDKAAVDYSFENNVPLMIVKNKERDSKKASFYDVGVIGNIMKKIVLSDGKIKILFQGMASAKVTSIDTKENTLLGECQLIKIQEYDKDKISHFVKILKEQLTSFTKVSNVLPYDLLKSLLDIEDPARLCELVASSIRIDDETSYRLFIQTDMEKKITDIIEILSKDAESIKIQKELKDNIYSKIEKNNKEYVLKEQMKEIRKELGDENYKSDEVKKYKKNLKNIKSHISKSAYNEIKKQIIQYDRIQQDSSSDAYVLQNYLDSVFKIPFGKYSKKKLSIKKVQSTLDKEHFALEKPKNAIIEYFATREFLEKKKKDFRELKGNILCFVGPPGVGKTSLANSIANALKRKLVRIAIGGMEDISELRGHRRTYIGAMAGQIIQGLSDAKELNPVMVLDEVDKVGRSHRGDLSSVLLEVLDPEQNKSFRDYYINFGVDLSSVMFIATANDPSRIPVALRDRMEFVFVHSYTPSEKMHIAQEYLIPQEMKQHSLNDKEFNINKSALKIIIENYTREAGVRGLRRQISKVIRKSIKEILDKKIEKVSITSKNIKKYLDKEVFEFENIDKINQVGVVNGLAWTSVGGDILKIEAIKTIGKGIIYRTGSMGDVMKESSQIAFSVIKELIDKNKINIDINTIVKLVNEKDTSKIVASDIYKRYDIHLHLPEGATPKDGPSAGGAMAVVFASIFSNRKIKKDIAMTGELTLTGKILPIGGLKEKLIAAFKGNVKQVLIPKKNYIKDLDDIPDEVKENIEIIGVEHIDEVLDYSLI